MNLETQLRTHLRSEAAAPIPPAPAPSTLRATARRRRNRNRLVTAGTIAVLVTSVTTGGLFLLAGTSEDQRIEVIDDPPIVSDEQSTRTGAQLRSSAVAEAADIQIRIDPEAGSLPAAATAAGDGFALVMLGQAGEPARAFVSDDGRDWTTLGTIDGPIGRASSLQLGHSNGTYKAVAATGDQIVVGSSHDLLSWTTASVDGPTPGRDLIIDLELTENGLGFTTELRRARTEELVAVLRLASRLPDEELDLICSYWTESSSSETIGFGACLDEPDQDRPESQPSQTVLTVDNSDPLHGELMAVVGSVGSPEVSIWSGPLDGPFIQQPSGVSELDLASTSDHLVTYAGESRLLTVSDDGIEWRPVQLPDGAGPLLKLMTLDDELVLLSPTNAIVSTDLGQTWETVKLGSGEGREEWLDGPQPATGEGGLAVQGTSFPRELFDEVSEPVSVQVDGYTLTITVDEHLVLTRSNEGILDLDLNAPATDNLSITADGSWTVHDPATGEELVRIAAETASELTAALFPEQRSIVVSQDARSWQSLALDGIEHDYVVPLVVGADEVLVLGIDRTVNQTPAAQVYRVPLEG